MMLFAIKKLIFKFMELGLGLRTCFPLETRNPIFVNFRLSAAESDAVTRALPPGWRLMPIRFCDNDPELAHFVSYNLYELKYPKPELQHIRKVRCEINTFVVDPKGRKGVFVFSGSPYVSREEKFSPIGFVCDLAERAVVWIYGVGRLTGLRYRLTQDELEIGIEEGPNRAQVKQAHTLHAEPAEKLSADYWEYNDISFFNGGRTHDFVHVTNAFYAARFHRLDGAKFPEFKGPFFDRKPDEVLFHFGDIPYLTNSMNRS
jgi:hypothetical protein